MPGAFILILLEEEIFPLIVYCEFHLRMLFHDVESDVRNVTVEGGGGEAMLLHELYTVQMLPAFEGVINF